MNANGIVPTPLKQPIPFFGTYYQKRTKIGKFHAEFFIYLHNFFIVMFPTTYDWYYFALSSSAYKQHIMYEQIFWSFNFKASVKLREKQMRENWFINFVFLPLCFCFTDFIFSSFYSLALSSPPSPLFILFLFYCMMFVYFQKETEALNRFDTKIKEIVNFLLLQDTPYTSTQPLALNQKSKFCYSYHAVSGSFQKLYWKKCYNIFLNR